MFKKIFNCGNFVKFGGVVCILCSIGTVINHKYINPIHFGIYGIVIGLLFIIEGFSIGKSKKKQA